MLSLIDFDLIKLPAAMSESLQGYHANRITLALGVNIDKPAWEFVNFQNSVWNKATRFAAATNSLMLLHVQQRAGFEKYWGSLDVC